MFCEDSLDPSDITTQREVTQALLLDPIRVSTALAGDPVILHWFLSGVSAIVLENNRLNWFQCGSDCTGSTGSIVFSLCVSGLGASCSVSDVAQIIISEQLVPLVSIMFYHMFGTENQ